MEERALYGCSPISREIHRAGKEAVDTPLHLPEASQMLEKQQPWRDGLAGLKAGLEGGGKL